MSAFTFTLAFPSCILAGTTAPASSPADPLDPPLGVFADEWFAVMMAGKKCGRMHTRMQRIKGPDGDLIESWSKMQITVLRGTAEISVALDSRTIETLDGRPQSFRRVMYLGKQPVISEGTIRDGQVSITTTQLGMPATPQTHGYPEGALMEWGAFREQIRQGLAPGTRYEMLLYDPTVAPDKGCRTTIEVVGPDVVDLFGRKVNATKVRQVTRLPSLLGGPTEQESTVWLTDAATAVRMETPLLDFRIDIIACPKTVAMAPNDPAELMLETLVPLAKPLHPESARKITYRIRLKKAADEIPLPSFPETAMQQILAADPRRITLAVTRRSALADRSAEKLSDEDRRRYLTPSAAANFKDPKVAELARQVGGAEKDPWKLADKLSRFVCEYITGKNLSVGFATASEVARSREGDCTEHGVLLAALARYHGIPSRVATGLVYTNHFEGRSNVLVGHLWTQLWIDGQWVDIDPTLHQHTDVDPSHIVMAIGAINDDGFADLVAATWLSLGRFAVDVVEVEP
ncbi:MAG TPA: transglutaminase family protein [Phycisphaerae bacterium]|nr:transglutaminase family protein [Phycisphaerae bacterium]